MANLPTAHASQSFGARQIDFYAAPGLVVGSDPRARPDERRIQDNDGARHTVRLSDKRFRLEPGDAASVVRLQPGPSRRSRPVAVINYETSSWTRTLAPSAGLLSQAGVSRAANWLAAVAALFAAALVAAYPALRTFFAELSPGLAGALPAFDLFGLIGAQLGAWRLVDSLGGLPAAIEAASPALAGLGAPIAYAGLVAGGAILAYAARSWRLVWIPALIAGAAAGAYGIAGAAAALTPFLAAMGGVFVLFALGGIVNRWRDAARLDNRIEQLADHVMRHPPEEYVSGVAVREARAEADAQTGEDDVPPLPETQTEAEASEGPADEAEARADEARDIALPPPPPMPAASGFRDPRADETAEPAAFETGETGPVEAQADEEAAEQNPEADGGASHADTIEAEVKTPAPRNGAAPGAPAPGSAAADLDGPALGAPPAWPSAPLPDNVVPIFAAPPPAAPPEPPKPKDAGDEDKPD